jgi:hypothetical protein
MKPALLGLLLCAGLVFAQENRPSSDPDHSKKNDKNEVTVDGCLSRSGGDYVLTKQNPPQTFELQGSQNISLRNYLGQQVEVTGHKSQTLGSSTDVMSPTGSPSPLTITVSSIKTISKKCPLR